MNMKNGKYKIEFVDGTTVVTYDEIILQNNILYKKDLEEALIHKISLATLDYDCYHKVLKYALVKIRCQKEIEDYMNRLDILESKQQEIILKLKENHVLDEHKFVQSFISDQIHLSNHGPNRIKKELLDYGIPISMIEKYLSDYDSSLLEEKIINLIQKKIPTQHCSHRVFEQKMLQYLVNLGYDTVMIKKCLATISFDSTKSLEKDYEILRKKLSLKYQGAKLTLNIKNKLYQKGYLIDEINELLQEKEA